MTIALEHTLDYSFSQSIYMENKHLWIRISVMGKNKHMFQIYSKKISLL